MRTQESLKKENWRINFKKKAHTKLTKELQEGVTYKSGVDLVNISDSTEIPYPSEVPVKVTLEDVTNYKKIYCDIETTSLSKTCDIIQLAAVCEHDSFNTYIMPSKPISDGASQVTGLSCHGNVLFYNGSPVHTVALKESLSLFLAWLQDRQPCILIGHNLIKFDLPRILHAYDISKLLFNFQNSIAAVIDTLPLFQELHPELDKHNQEFLIHHFVKEGYGAHNALEDVKSLQTLVTATNITDELLCKHSLTVNSAIDFYLFDKKTDGYIDSMTCLIKGKILTAAMCKKVARSGLGLCHLKLAVSRGGLDGLYSVLSEKVNGKPRVTAVKRIASQLFEFLNAQ